MAISRFKADLVQSAVKQSISRDVLCLDNGFFEVITSIDVHIVPFTREEEEEEEEVKFSLLSTRINQDYGQLE